MKISVTAKRPNFRRAGLVFSDKEATVLPAESLTKDQLEALKAEPALVVVEIPEQGDADTSTEPTGTVAELLERAAALGLSYAQKPKKEQLIDDIKAAAAAK